jgi:hypothetical protein
MFAGILYHERFPIENRMAAEGDAALDLAEVEADCGFEPLPLLIDQRDCGNWRLADARRQLHEAVEDRFRWRVKDMERVQNRETPSLVRIGAVHEILHLLTLKQRTNNEAQEAVNALSVLGITYIFVAA